MIVYDGSKTDFMKGVDEDTIAFEIEDRILKKMNRKTSRSEFHSWENSLKNMYIVLNDANIPDDCGVAIEYNIPCTNKRVDFLLSGYDQKDTGNVIIIELKQWSELTAIDAMDAMVETYTGGALRQVVHPSYQAWSYASMIRDYNQSVQDDHILLHPCAFLHNYRREDNDDLDAGQYAPYLQDAPAFTKGQVSDLRTFIKKDIVRGDNTRLIDAIDNGHLRPSKSLQDAIVKMLDGNEEFVMLDDQKVVYENIRLLSRRCQKDGKKRCLIIQGGPGTGKTVVAINLLAHLTNDGQVVQYVSKNSAPRNVYKAKLKGTRRKKNIDFLFKGSGSYTDTQANAFDTLLVDEAHRLNEKSGLFSNLGENQIREIIHAARCSVFFIDESQRVTLKDIGSVEEIRKHAEEEGAEVEVMKLASQFRCNGSDGYLAWLDNVLDIRETANEDLEDINYDIQVFDSPQKVYDVVCQKNNASQNKARLLAGYCWNWNSAGKNNTDVHDIKIGDFEISWNLGNTETYAIDGTSIHEAGCIHTSQGLEFDYVGVIIGEDMRYENGHIVTDCTKRAKTDNSLRGIKKMAQKDPDKASQVADEIIKNTYRTLMTRGMKGCYVYCVDPNLAEYLRTRMKKGQSI